MYGSNKIVISKIENHLKISIKPFIKNWYLTVFEHLRKKPWTQLQICATSRKQQPG